MDLPYVFIWTVVSLAVMFLLTKLMGQKQVSQLNLFDYIVGITIGSIAAELSTETENPEKPLLAMVIYGLVAFAISIITTKSTKLRRAITGVPLILMRGDVIYRNNLKKAKLDINDFLMSCRSNGYFDPSEIELAVLEHNGVISFLPKEWARPVNASDVNAASSQNGLPYDVIRDGIIDRAALKKCGKDEKWLKKELKKQGFDSEKNIMLGCCTGDGNTVFYKDK